MTSRPATARRTHPTKTTLPDLPDGPVAVSEVLPHVVHRFTLRLDEVVEALGVSRRSIERERAAGRFPKPDLMLGRMPLWRPEAIRQWVERGGRS